MWTGQDRHKLRYDYVLRNIFEPWTLGRIRYPEATGDTGRGPALLLESNQGYLLLETVTNGPGSHLLLETLHA